MSYDKTIRRIKEADYIIMTGATIRETAKEFGISKSTVYLDVTERLEKISHRKAMEVREILDFNKKERAVRGGLGLARARARARELQENLKR